MPYYVDSIMFRRIRGGGLPDDYPSCNYMVAFYLPHKKTQEGW